MTTLAPPPRPPSRSRARWVISEAARRPRVGGWAAFCALALYATLRWDTMLLSADRPHVLGSLAVALIGAGLVRGLPRRAWVLGVITVAELIAVFVVAGVPLSWLASGHLGRVVDLIDQGVSAIGSVLVPYRGGERSTVTVLALGGGALLGCAGLMFGAVRERPGTEPLALAALPLIVLAVVPSTIVQPRVGYLHGLITFVLVVLFVFGPRVRPSRGGATVLLCLLATAIAVAAVLALDGGRPWVRTGSGPRTVGPTVSGQAVVESFDWRQGYGQLGPQSTQIVLSISARRPLYWKAEDLDDFTGAGWVPGQSQDDGLEGVSARNRVRYSESVHVDVGSLTSPQVITAGVAARPSISGALPGPDPGSWITNVALSPGDQYTVRVYAPDPSSAQLARTGRAYPAALAPLRRATPTGSDAAAVEALAGRLAARAATPIAYVHAVLDYLGPGDGFTYTLTPPAAGANPITGFLIHTHAGYCQQFAGAMALLLRLDAIPARVAVGFSPGARSAGSRVSDVAADDAHAWVEAWFPGYGWVTFDPTPGRPAIGAAATTGGTGAGTLGSVPTTPQTSAPAQSSRQAAAAAVARRRAGARTDAGQGSAGRSGSGHRDGRSGAGEGGGVAVAVIVLSGLAGLAALGVLILLLPRVRALGREAGIDELTTELERACATCGLALGPQVTLAALERRVAERDRPAAGYVHALATGRYSGGAIDGPSAASRTALRRWLANELLRTHRIGRLDPARLGPPARLAARAWVLWALPPRRLVRSRHPARVPETAPAAT